MSNPVSVLTSQAQPNTQFYGLQALTIFTNYTRASYLATFGVQAPNEDPTRPEQDWFDSTANGPKVYPAFDYIAGKMGSITVQNPNVPNIPGVQTYNPYVIAPTYGEQQHHPNLINNMHPVERVASLSTLSNNAT